MIKMVVFDMAGTTVDEDNVVYKTLQKAMLESGFNFTLDQVLAEGAGKEKLQAIKSVLKVYGHTENHLLADRIYNRFIELLAKAYQTQEIIPQKNANELFRKLRERNILVALNTGYNEETAETIIRKLGWKKGLDYDDMITASDVKNNRPEPDMILLAMSRFGIRDAAEVIKVGDSIIDIQEGKSAGCALNIGITTGAHTLQQLRSAEPDYVIDNLLELIPILDKIGQAEAGHTLTKG